MRAAILEEPKRLIVKEVPDPEPPPGGLVLDIKAALTCGTDVKTYLRGHPKIPLPSPLGHEFAGVVSAVGEGQSRFAVGDEVMCVHTAPCLECFYCRQGLHNLCETIMDTKVLGAFAERIALPAHIVAQNAFAKPRSLGFAQAAFLEPLACVVHGLRQVEVELGEIVVVLGAGPIGLLFTTMLQREGCQVLVVEPHEQRRQAALRQKADRVAASLDEAESALHDATGGHGADAVIECTGRPDVWQETLRLVRRGGRVLLFGGTPAGAQVSFDAGRLHYDQLTLRGAFHFTPDDVAQAAGILSSGDLDPSPLLTGETDLDGLPEALERLSRGEGIKMRVKP